MLTMFPKKLDKLKSYAPNTSIFASFAKRAPWRQWEVVCQKANHYDYCWNIIDFHKWKHQHSQHKLLHMFNFDICVIFPSLDISGHIVCHIYWWYHHKVVQEYCIVIRVPLCFVVQNLLARSSTKGQEHNCVLTYIELRTIIYECLYLFV